MKTLELLRECIGDRVISNGAAVVWSPQSPDLTILDFLLCGHIKEVLFKDIPESLGELQEAVLAAISGISQETCARVAEEAKRRLILCAARNGGSCRKAVNVG